MSTLPYDPSSRTDSVPAVAAEGGEQAVEAVVREFESVADEVSMPRPAAEELREVDLSSSSSRRMLVFAELSIGSM